jgi:hypothetical protein
VTRAEFEVLNVIVLKKMCRAETVAEVLGIPQAVVEDTVATLERGELIGRADDLLLPIDAAEPALAGFTAQAYRDLRSDPASDGLYERFERINAQLLQTMAEWQQIDVGGHKVANDHSDRDYDEKVITTAARLVERLKPIAGALGERDSRFLRYGERFDAALDRVDRGERDYLSSPMLESVHNIWFEFHEDLLRALGKARTE